MQSLFLALSVGSGSIVAPPGPLTPPTVAPVLSVTTQFGSYTALLEWTASNKTTSDGFEYLVQVDISNGGWNIVAGGLTSLSYEYTDMGATGLLYKFRVFARNSAGDGPYSNEVSTVLPGE
jgi:hypothetical protein